MSRDSAVAYFIGSVFIINPLVSLTPVIDSSLTPSIMIVSFLIGLPIVAGVLYTNKPEGDPSVDKVCAFFIIISALWMLITIVNIIFNIGDISQVFTGIKSLIVFSIIAGWNLYAYENAEESVESKSGGYSSASSTSSSSNRTSSSSTSSSFSIPSPSSIVAGSDARHLDNVDLHVGEEILKIEGNSIVAGSDARHLDNVDLRVGEELFKLE